MLNRTNENDIEWMVEAYAEYVYRLAYQFTCDPVDAEDVTCATFLSARALCGHISECDCVAAVLYGITSSIAHEKLESNLNADDPDVDAVEVQEPLSSCVVMPFVRLAPTEVEVAGGNAVKFEDFLDVSLDRFRPGLEMARAALAFAIGQGETGL